MSAVGYPWLSGRLRPLLKPLFVSRLLGEATWIVTGQISAAVGGVVGVPLLAHCLRPEEYGQLALGGTVAALVQQVSLGPIGNAVGRFYATSVEDGTLGAYLRTGARMVLIACAVVLAIGGPALVTLALSRWRAYVALGGWSLIFAVLSGTSAVFDAIQSAARQRAIVAWHQGLGVWLRFGCAALLVRLLGGAEMAMAGFAAAAMVVLISQVLFVRRAILASPSYRSGFGQGVERGLLWRMWVYAWPFGSWGLFTWAQIASDRWALDAFTTARGVGLYQVLYQIGYYPISMASGFVNQLICPILFSRAGDGTDSARMRGAYVIIHYLLAATFLFSLTTVAIAALLAPPLFRIMLPSAYGSVSHLVPLMVLAAGVFACGQVASLKHVLSTSPCTLVVPKIATSVLGACLNVAGAYCYGIRGIVGASVCFSTIYCVWVIVTAPKLRSAA
jgi:O-antigen/teichoic acid export membrane protein